MIFLPENKHSRKWKQFLLLISLLSAFLTVYGGINLSSFLSPVNPVRADVLVVEGWLIEFDYMLDMAVSEIIREGYTLVLTTGKARQGKDVAEECKERLVNKGVDSDMVLALPSHATRQHRTYHSALPVKQYLNEHQITSVNIFSEGTHGRKTHVIYKKTLGNEFSVGIISSEIKHFDSIRWWTSVLGIRVTSRHLFGWIYALVWPFQAV